MKKLALILSVMVMLTPFNTFAGAHSFGDADIDGVIGASDSATVLQYTLNPESVQISTGNCDVDSDGVISSSDAAIILQKTLRNSFEMPVEKKNPAVTIDILSAETLEYGIYTQDIYVGDFVISASALNPVYVEDYLVWNDTICNHKTFEKTIRLSPENIIYINNKNENASVEFLFLSANIDIYNRNPLLDTCITDIETGQECYDIIYHSGEFNEFYNHPGWTYENLKADTTYKTSASNGGPIFLTSITMK